MSISLGRQLGIRSLVYVAGKPIPYFWPMRAFIHHNPLYGLEHLPFDEAVKKAENLFHARTALGRDEYQRYLAAGTLCRTTLLASAHALAQSIEAESGDDLDGLTLQAWFEALLTRPGQAMFKHVEIPSADAVAAALKSYPAESGEQIIGAQADDGAQLARQLKAKLSSNKPLYESLDALYGCGIGDELDELVIKACLDFFDEGQSVWDLPSRDKGLFRSWAEMASRNRWFSRRARSIHKIVAEAESPEAVIERTMLGLGVPEHQWMEYFTFELSRLHGWVGFIRWRESAKNYHWTTRYPADLVDYLALRLTLTAVILSEREYHGGITNMADLQSAIDDNPFEMYLRHELYSGQVYPPLAQQVEQTLVSRQVEAQKKLCQQYIQRKQACRARQCARQMLDVAKDLPLENALKQLDSAQIAALLSATKTLEDKESALWLNAMEQHSMRELLGQVSLQAPEQREKRPFVQALFCIDTRSERIRRHLEAVGDYETYGIAGFFGVPFSFMEHGKGSETHLCPILLTPKNLVLEISRDEEAIDVAAITTLEKAMHELKESILTPFVTVEAIGLLFGFDMIGKTLAPTTYTHWRRHLHQEKPITYLLQDKLSREQADSIVRAVQRTVIVNAVEHELAVPKEQITDDIVRQLRECAMEHEKECPAICQQFGMDSESMFKFITRLQRVYRINPSAARMQMERLGRIGFSIEEQVGFVSQALRSIGLVQRFSRFVLLVGHGSTSQNNPYESALDCGACGGNHGLVNARVLAHMANKPKVRARLAKQGLSIDDDVCFVPAMHNTTTDELKLHDLDLLPSSHLIYIDRLRNGLVAASRLCARERLGTLQPETTVTDPSKALLEIQRNAMDWSQVRPEWGLSRNVYFIIGRRDLTRDSNLEGRSFLHSYDYQADPKRRLLENILGGPLVVGQWINMEHYFSTVDNERFGSGSKVYHNVAGRFGVMTGNLSDLRTGLPAQTVLQKGKPYHEPMRLITVIEAPLRHAEKAVDSVAAVKRLVRNHWVRLIVIDPETGLAHRFAQNDWEQVDGLAAGRPAAAGNAGPNLDNRHYSATTAEVIA